MGRTITDTEFEELYRATAVELLGYVRRRGAPDVEDLVAEVYATAWRRRGDLPSATLRRAWLYGVARRLLLAGARRDGQEHAALEAAAREDAGPPDFDRTREEVVAAALARLGDAEREILQLVEWERLAPAEVAVVLGVRAGTARVRLHRARQALAADPEVRRLVGAEAAVPNG